MLNVKFDAETSAFISNIESSAKKIIIQHKKLRLRESRSKEVARISKAFTESMKSNNQANECDDTLPSMDKPEVDDNRVGATKHHLVSSPIAKQSMQLYMYTRLLICCVVCSYLHVYTPFQL